MRKKGQKPTTRETGVPVSAVTVLGNVTECETPVSAVVQEVPAPAAPVTGESKAKTVEVTFSYPAYAPPHKVKEDEPTHSYQPYPPYLAEYERKRFQRELQEKAQERNPSKAEVAERSEAERRRLWLDAYEKEYVRQVPLCEPKGAKTRADPEAVAAGHKEAARRAAKCADAMFLELAVQKAQKEEEKAQKEEDRARAEAAAPVLGPAALMEMPLFQAYAYRADLDALTLAWEARFQEIEAALSSTLASKKPRSGRRTAK